MLTPRRWHGIGDALFCVVLVLVALSGRAAAAKADELDAASPQELIEILKANVYLTGDIVKRMNAQSHLQRLGRQDPGAVVPLVLAELAPPRSYGKIAAHQRLALIELLRDIGPAAEQAVPRLVEILNDPEEPFETVKTQAATALTLIGTEDAKSAVEAYYAGLNAAFAETASSDEAARTVTQSAYLIRQELRSREPSDEVIGASVDLIQSLGPKASSAQPTLLRAYGDPRLSSALRDKIAASLRATGVPDVEAAAQAAAQTQPPDILAEVIAETRSEDALVSSLAMGELGRLGPSEPAIDALIAALREDRNPGDAARILGNFGDRAERALPELVRYFDDERAGANAIQAAGKIGVAEPDTIAALRRLLATPGHRHRGMAASALGALHATEAVPELQQALGDGGKYDRILAANALGELGPDAAPAVEALAAGVADPDLDLRRAAVEALGRIGPPAASASTLIAEQLDSGDARLEAAARDALAAIGGGEAEAALEADARRFTDADLAEARRLASAGGLDGLLGFLTDLPDRRATLLSRRLVSEPSPDSALAGAFVLARQGDIEPAVPVLADNLARRAVSDQLLTGLIYAMMHGGDEAAVAPLIQSLRQYIEDNPQRYSAEERARLESLFRQARPEE
jgi:HEAT repeat protein